MPLFKEMLEQLYREAQLLRVSGLKSEQARRALVYSLSDALDAYGDLRVANERDREVAA